MRVSPSMSYEEEDTCVSLPPCHMRRRIHACLSLPPSVLPTLSPSLPPSRPARPLALNKLNLQTKLRVQSPHKPYTPVGESMGSGHGQVGSGHGQVASASRHVSRDVARASEPRGLASSFVATASDSPSNWPATRQVRAAHMCLCLCVFALI